MSVTGEGGRKKKEFWNFKKKNSTVYIKTIFFSLDLFARSPFLHLN